jgi:hypothetical protein
MMHRRTARSSQLLNWLRQVDRLRQVAGSNPTLSSPGPSVELAAATGTQAPINIHANPVSTRIFGKPDQDRTGARWPRWSALRSADDAQIRPPRAHFIRVLASEHSRNLHDVIEVVCHPGCQKLP